MARPGQQRAAAEEHVPVAIDDWVLPSLPYRSVRGDVVMALGILLIGVMVAVTGFGRGPAPEGGPLVPLLAAVVAASSLLAKRRWPVVACVGCGAALVGETALVGAGLNLALLIALFDALYAAALVGRPWERRTILVGCTVAGAVLVASSRGDADDRIQVVLSLVALLGSPLFIGTASRQREELIQAEKARAAAERQRADAVLRAATAERERAVRSERATLARDLHDAVAAHLSAIALQSAATSRASGDTASAMRAVRESSLEALAELRQLIDVLNAEDPGDLPLKVPPGIEETGILRGDAERLGVALELEVDAPREDLTTATSHVLMRIAREAVVNAARHAPGAPLRLTVRAEDEGVLLTASNPLPDERPAADPSSPQDTSGGLGTVIMTEQAAAVGGRCDAGPSDDGTWVVRATVPRHRSPVVPS
ncbi:sensor histidine kinase [Georgenia alba]|uniref:histidine kinase n=1 Tax=Georgenia alba TaxID=2233858 RepID=A0ABW2QBS4_9MICO